MFKCFFFLLILGMLLAQESPRLVFVKSAGLGDTVTLHCEDKMESMETNGKGSKQFYWYKQSPGYFPEMVASIEYKTITVETHLKLRFTVEEGAYDLNLTIRNVTKGDEANYFCQKYRSQKWNNWTFLSVKGMINPFCCSNSIS